MLALCLVACLSLPHFSILISMGLAIYNNNNYYCQPHTYENEYGVGNTYSHKYWKESFTYIVVVISTI